LRVLCRWVLRNQLGADPSLDFANTVDPRHGQGRREYLLSYADLLAWSRVVGALGDQASGRLAGASQRRPHEAAQVLDRALRLREALYRLFSGRAADDADLATLNAELGQAMGQARVLSAEPGFAWTWPEEEADLARPLCRSPARPPSCSPHRSWSGCANAWGSSAAGCSWTPARTTAVPGAAWTTAATGPRPGGHYARRRATTPPPGGDGRR
jgi:hypothetical protein